MKNVFTLFFLWAFLTSSWAQSYYINEVDYLGDQQGVEIAGPDGTDLNQVALVFYKVDGTVSKIEYLNGTIPTLGGQQGTVWYDVAMTDPGSATDGGSVALIDQSAQVVNFISYGLSAGVTAIEGAATGQTAELIGSQLLPASTLQLVGRGLTYIEFVWSLPGLATPGLPNLEQTFFGLYGDVFGLSVPGTSSSMEMWPNPAHDQIRIQLALSLPSDQLEVQLIDLTGRILKRTVIYQADVIEWSVSELPKGMYIVQIQQEDKILEQQRLMKR